ncbi:MAG: phosphopentomutase [Dethiobacter sp.]|jgi:phosphopentomutase|nr:phosphopentomutase [Dethiobacter sp.]
MNIKRVILIVLDSLGVGELPDASFYGDAGSNTLAHIAKATGGLKLPMLESFGLGCLTEVLGMPCTSGPVAAFAKMAERSKGKDTTTGHWEMTGVVLDEPFPVYPRGFPPQVISAFERAVGREVLGNVAASGTEIIERLGEAHLASGRPIVYTSADSVFQIAAHEEVAPLELLYDWCVKARGLLQGEHAVGRVIARPFTGESGQFRRTPNRRDYSLTPPSDTLLDILKKQGMPVIGVGKIADIFANRGLTASLSAKSNDYAVDMILQAMDNYESGLIFANLVDFDSVYGHRNDAAGYAGALIQFDLRLKELMAKMRTEDVLFITADHGCDPTFPHTDHTREYVPMLAYGENVRPLRLDTRDTFADLGATISCLLKAPGLLAGQHFCKELGLDC